MQQAPAAPFLAQHGPTTPQQHQQPTLLRPELTSVPAVLPNGANAQAGTVARPPQPASRQGRASQRLLYSSHLGSGSDSLVTGSGLVCHEGVLQGLAHAAAQVRASLRSLAD